MPAPKNNTYYKLRRTNGRLPLFEDPEELYKEACQYFAWSDANPLKEQKVFGNGKRMTVKRMRAYTLKALCLYLGITEKTFGNYRDKETFSEVVEFIESIIYTQKFEGAAAGILHPQIIARDLGLKDASDITTAGQSLNDAFSATVGAVRRKIKTAEQSS